MTEQDVITAFITISAVVLGFILSQLSEHIKTHSKVKNEQQSLKQLISLETNKNIEQLRKYWNALIESEEEWSSKNGDFLNIQLASSIGRRPFPILKHSAWEANIGKVASVYNESELIKIWDHYTNMENLYDLYRFFYEAAKQKENTARFHQSKEKRGFGGAIGSLVSNFEFAGVVEDHSPEFKNIIETVLKTKV